MKKDIINQLKKAIEITDNDFKTGKRSHSYLVGYLQGTMKGVIEYLEQENVELKFKK